MSNYKRQRFESGVLKNTQQNFARFDKAVQLRNALREKVAEKVKANQGAFTPGTLTTEVNQKFGGVKQKLQEIVTNKGLQNAPFLDKKSDYYNNAVEANYNNTKQSATDGLLAMNKAMTAYEEYMEAYKQDNLNFNPQEYEEIQGKWAKINEFVNNPGRLGFDDSGNITVAVYNEETEQDDYIPLSQWDVLNFESALKPVAEPDYTENFIGYLGDNPENWDIATQDAIQQAGGRENPNFLGMVTDYIEDEYGADLPGIDDMIMDPRYQKEAIDRAVSFAKNRKTERGSGSGSGASKIKPATKEGMEKVLDVDSAVQSPLRKNSAGEIVNDEELRNYIKTYTQRRVEIWPNEFETFMRERGFEGEYTTEDIENEWYNYIRDTQVPSWQDPNIESKVAGGVTKDWEDKKVKGGVTKSGAKAVTLSFDARYNDSNNQFTKQGNQHMNTVSDKSGFGHFAYDLEGTAESEGSNFFAVDLDIQPYAGAMVLGEVNQNEKGVVNKEYPHAERGPVSFAPKQILNNVPILAKSFNFEDFSRILEERNPFIGSGAKRGMKLNPGAVLSDQMLDVIKEALGDKWKETVKFGPAAYGSATFEDKRARGNYTKMMLVPFEQMREKLTANTGHNFNNITDPQYNLQNLSTDELDRIMLDPNMSDEWRRMAKKLLGL